MDCDICGRAHDAQRRPFLCAVDARNLLYEKRMAHAAALMENETLEQQIDVFLENPTSSAAETSAPPRVRLDTWKSEEHRALERTNEIIAQADRLRAEVEAARKEIDERKAAIARRKAELAAASSKLAPRRARQQEELERAGAMTKFKWKRSSDSMAATRGFLCMEAARLYGLRRSKKGSATHYELGGIEIVEMSTLNSQSPSCYY